MATMIVNVLDVETIDQLLTYISAFGVPTDCESVCHMQDVVGHTPYQTLRDIARNEYGERDCYGNAVRKYRDRFYFLLSRIWNWEDLCSFWNTVSNREHAECLTLREENKELRAEIETRKQIEERMCAEISELRNRSDVDDRVRQLELEVLTLKAKLYDLTCE